MEDEQKVLEEFLSFTGVEDEAKATNFLQAANWSLPDAVQLFFAEQTSNEPGPSEEEESVRAPLPTRFERIIDRSETYERMIREREKQTPIYEAFRNHAAEMAQFEQGPNAKEKMTGLADLYKAPIDLLFRGSFEEAKETAMAKNLWLMVNVQSPDEFASHQLNSDTFSNEPLREMIKANFIFFQTYVNGVTGERLAMMYKIQKCPAILIIDPITGGLMKSFTGFVEAERLIEHLVQYMDCSPDDEVEARKIQNRQKPRNKSSEETRSGRHGPVMTKEIQNALAIAFESSKKRKSEKRNKEAEPSAGQDESPSQNTDTPVGQSDLLESVSQRREPVASLIPETRGDNTCVVGILLPTGRRLQRVFYKTDKIESLYAFCNEQFPEAKEKEYKLTPRNPGSKPVTDWALGIESAGVAGTLMGFIWD